MGKKETVEALVEGGKASAGPPIGSTLGPMGVNIGEVVAEINNKTSAFKGMKVPVKIIIDTEDKSFSIEIGTPPVSALIKKELNLQKGSGIPHKDKVANMSVEQVIKVAGMKKESMFVNDMKAAVKCVAGSANIMGVLVEGVSSDVFCNDVNAGKYDDVINANKTEHDPSKNAVLKEQLDAVKAENAAYLAKIKAKSEEAAAKKDEKKEEAPAAAPAK